jgi:hypothetical protein
MVADTDLTLEDEVFNAWNDWLDQAGLTASDAPFHAYLAGVEWAEDRYRELLAAARGWQTSRQNLAEANEGGSAEYRGSVEAAFNEAQQSLWEAVAGFDDRMATDSAT